MTRRDGYGGGMTVQATPREVPDDVLMRSADRRATIYPHPLRQWSTAAVYDSCGWRCGTPIREGDRIVTIDGRPHHLEHHT